MGLHPLTLDSRTSFSLGRPFTLDASEITVRKPDSPSQGTWLPYGQSNGNIASDSRDSIGMPDFLGLITEQRTSLCGIVEPIARALCVQSCLIRQFRHQADTA